MFVNTQTNKFLQHSRHTLLCQGQFLTGELLNMITSIEMLTNKTMTLHLHILFFCFFAKRPWKLGQEGSSNSTSYDG